MFSLSMAGYTHSIIVTPSLAKSLLQQKLNVINNHSLVWYLIDNFHGIAPEVHQIDPSIIFKEIHSVHHILMKESYLEKVMSQVKAAIETHVADLVSFDEKHFRHRMWQDGGDGKLVKDDPYSMEISLFPLIRNFVSLLTTPILMGTDFMRNFPYTVEDLWEFDAGMLFFLLKMPSWIPSKKNRNAHAARARILSSMIEFFTAMEHVLDGYDPGPRWQNLKDVSELMWERCKTWKRNGVPPEHYAGGEIALLWAFNINSPNVVFWLLIRICSNPNILGRVRNEIAPFASPTHLNLNTKDSFYACNLNIQGIDKHCHFFTACEYECFRMDIGTSSIRTAQADFVIKESAADTFDGALPQSYLIRKGEVIHVNHDLLQKDARYFPDPGRFIPERFLAEEEIQGSNGNDEGTGEKNKVLVAKRGIIRPFGAGPNMCVGQKFAEREILLFVAGLLIAWEFSPVGGEWILPGHKRTAGAYMPDRDFRVKVKRRRE